MSAIGDDGAVSGLLLWYRSFDGQGRWLECEVDALREGLAAAPTAPIIGFFPEDVAVSDISNLVSMASSALAATSVVASFAPVTDAVKLVDGRSVRRGVDRSTLRKVHGPAFARADAIRNAMGDRVGGTIRPLLAAATLSRRQIGSLEAARVV